MAHTAVASPDDGEDIGARLLKLNLPRQPLIMEKIRGPRGTHCRHSEAERCWCYEYTTMLDRPDYKWVPDSPEPQEKVLANGNSRDTGRDTRDKGAATGGSAAAGANGVAKVVEKKKFSLGQYNNRKAAGKAPAKTNPLPAAVVATGTASKNSPATAVDKKAMDSSLDPQEPVRNFKEPRRSPPRTRDEPPPKKRQRTPSPLPPPPPPPPPPQTPNLPILPPLLSPTLPPAVEEALALENKTRGTTGTRDDGYDTSTSTYGIYGSAQGKRVHGSTNASQVASDTDRLSRKTVAPGKKLPSSSINTPSARSPRPTNPSPTKAIGNKTIPKSGLGGNNTPKSVASKTVGKRPASPKPSSPLPRNPKISSKYPPTPASNVEPEKKSRIVKLKYHKRRAKDIATLLRLKPNPAVKRPRQEDDHHLPAPAAKRQKAPVESLTVAASGRSPAFKSPALKVPKDTRDRDLMTTPPKKTNGNLATAALKRTGSEGQPQTPHKEERNGIGRKPLDGSTQSKVEQFRAEYQKYADWGKGAKYEADRTFKNQADANMDKEKFRLATVVALDSVLCYILSFMCEEEAKALEQRSPPVEMWRSIVPLSKFVADKAASYPPLYGLCKQLEATIRQHLFDMEINVYEKLPLPDTTSKAPTPDSGTNGMSNDRAAYLRYKTSIIKEARELKDCWLEGTRHLTHDDIQNRFPQTFAQRARKFVDPANVTPRIGKYKHPFQLPLHRNTTMLEALNFGFLFLQEWVAAEGIRFQSKLNSCL